MKKVGLLLIISGIILISWNAYAFCLGYFSYTKTPPKQTQLVEDSPSEEVINQHLYADIPTNGEKIGDLFIPRLEKTFPIFQGTDHETLKKGIGHFSRSVLPGEKNNSVLSGHRDTVFRGLKDLELHDHFVVSTIAGEFIYKIKKIRIVDADDHTVIKPKPRSTLTLTTCYPFYFLGDAPQRYIIVSELISGKERKKNASAFQSIRNGDNYAMPIQ
ncbi:class D sortase [Litchfieldia alkalitelluris]|uniref:class D sortase n=1 Tax=Litchfieldia alkalitelluris TaxID=304268 RepID=UPI000998732A|nr:class D sortase [Litchfieldia alkalitelluris]